MKYFSEEEVKRILYDIDYNWKSLPQWLYDYKYIELPENKWNTGKPPMTFEAEGDYLVVFRTKNKREQYGLAEWGPMVGLLCQMIMTTHPLLNGKK